jgi:hypothetical protein
MRGVFLALEGLGCWRAADGEADDCEEDVDADIEEDGEEDRRRREVGESGS